MIFKNIIVFSHLQKVFLAENLPPVGFKSYYIEKVAKNRRRLSFKSKLQRLIPGQDHIISTDVMIIRYKCVPKNYFFLFLHHTENEN